MEGNKQKKVVVAMSGGVDSSVAAALLVKQGYEVIGISLKVWDEGEGASPRAKTCCSYRDIEDARDVCSILGIPFYAFNFKKEFKERVIDPFVEAYSKGFTPNPCILCNHYVKFDLLLNEAKKMGADFLATGHHARVLRDAEGASHLVKGIDAAKDQSYVLYHLTQDELRHILLPVGDYTKEDVRRIAVESGIPTAMKPESQDICFIPSRDHASFIENHFPDKAASPGPFVDKKGRILGTHRGIHAYTVGQRRGLGIAGEERYYVTRIDPILNEVELGFKDEVRYEGLHATQVNWLRKVNPRQLNVKVRYQKNEIPSFVDPLPDSSEVHVRFAANGSTVSPGQACVFYDGDEVVGGGTILKSMVWEESL